MAIKTYTPELRKNVSTVLAEAPIDPDTRKLVPASVLKLEAGNEYSTDDVTEQAVLDHLVLIGVLEEV